LNYRKYLVHLHKHYKGATMNKKMVCHIQYAPLQEVTPTAINTIRPSLGKPAVYISLNTSKQSLFSEIKKANLQKEDIRVIDCVNEIIPQKDKLPVILERIRKNISDGSSIIIDAFSSLLVYVTQEELIKFIRELKQIANKSNSNIYLICAQSDSSTLPPLVTNACNT